LHLAEQSSNHTIQRKPVALVQTASPLLKSSAADVEVDVKPSVTSKSGVEHSDKQIELVTTQPAPTAQPRAQKVEKQIQPALVQAAPTMQPHAGHDSGDIEAAAAARDAAAASVAAAAAAVAANAAAVSAAAAARDAALGVENIGVADQHIVATDARQISSHSQVTVNSTGPRGLGSGIRLFSNALVSHWQQHGIWGSFYGSSKAHKNGVQPSIFLGVVLILFIVAQLAALAFVACHAHSSLTMLRQSRAPTPQSGLRELIPGISWHDCVPYESRQRSNSGNLNQRRAKEDNVLGDEQIFGQMASQGWHTWTTKQKNQYMAASSDDGGQAANKARLQEMLAADRNSKRPAWARNPTKESLDKLQRSSTGAHTPRSEKAWDSLESTLAVATRRADVNKRILDLLHQAPKPNTLEAMLDNEYDVMAQMDLENNLTGLTRRERSPGRTPFAC